MPMAPTKGGSTSGARMSVERMPLPAKVVRAESIASGSAMQTATVVVQVAMRNALTRPSRRTGSLNTFATWKSVKAPSSATNALATPSQMG